MPSTIEWQVENRVILLTYTGKVSVEDVLYTTNTGIDWLEQTAEKVHVVNDLTQMEGLTSDFQNVGKILSVTRDFMGMDNLGLMVAYGTDNRLVKFLSTVVGQMGGITFRMFGTRAEALTYLSHNDTSLHTLRDEFS